MRILVVAALVVCVCADGLAQEGGNSAEYIGGTLRALADRTEGRLQTTDPLSLVFAWKQAVVRVPYERINLLEYGQKVGRRYAMAVVISPLLLMSKKRKHFLTVGYTDDEGQQQAMVFRVDKDDVRALLASLEARTGLKVQYQDEEARKAGKG